MTIETTATLFNVAQGHIVSMEWDTSASMLTHSEVFTLTCECKRPVRGLQATTTTIGALHQEGYLVAKAYVWVHHPSYSTWIVCRYVASSEDIITRVAKFAAKKRYVISTDEGDADSAWTGALVDAIGRPITDAEFASFHAQYLAMVA